VTASADPRWWQEAKDVLAAHSILTQYRVLIDGMALDDNDTYQKLVAELVKWKNS
jgi:hypothetical protein